MLDRLEAIKARFDQLGIALTNPEIVGNNKKFAETSKEYRSLEKIVTAYNDYKKILEDIDFYKEALEGNDIEMRELAKMEAPAAEEKKLQAEAYIRQLLIPKDPQDEKNAILEIRAGTGGDEASLFAGDLLRMYMRYCERRGWKTALLSENEGSVGGYKEVQLEVTGDDVYGVLKFESGVHRVQRVPDTVKMVTIRLVSPYLTDLNTIPLVLCNVSGMVKNTALPHYFCPVSSFRDTCSCVSTGSGRLGGFATVKIP